ncbi:MAG: pyridoxal phosphate-dependent aminotransferase [Gammaproteobacteria bacterium]|nr:pyridoxal phosphate-dependent aminotransferase [Gammaproteobacteria bacterium]
MQTSKEIPGIPVSLPDSVRTAIRKAAATLPESGIIEVVNYGRERPDLIPFWVGEADVPTPAFICDAAIQALRDGHTFYTYQRGIPQLREAISAYHQRHFSIDVNSERIIVTSSGMQAMMETMQTLVGAGDEVLVVSPVWPNIYACIHMQQATAQSVPLQVREQEWRFDLDRLFDSCNNKTRVIYINSPGNPTGWVINYDDMIAVRDFARSQGLWIVADEVYGKFVYGGERATSFLELMEPDERLVVTNTFSKNWCMTGWRVGWVVIPRELGQVYENLVQYNTSGTPAFLQYGCLTAINEGDQFIEEFVQRCKQGRDLVCDHLLELPNVELVRPRGAFYLFFRVKGEPDSVALAKRMVDEANVGLAPGTAFGVGGAEFVRMCFAASHDTLRTGVERLSEALNPRNTQRSNTIGSKRT